MYQATITYTNFLGDTVTSVQEHEDHNLIYAMALGAVKGALIGTNHTLLGVEIEKVSA
jgi:hypothetical protein